MHRVTLFFVLLCIGSAFSDDNEPKSKTLTKLSNLRYKFINVSDPEGCNHVTEPCAKLNDIWGYEFSVEDGPTQYYAVIGMENGIDIVDVTNPSEPKPVKFLSGCINNWRDIKRWENTLYGITEYTQTCACPEGEACMEKLNITAPEAMVGNMVMTEGRNTPQLSTVGPVSGTVVAVAPWEDKACNLISNSAELNGNIALIPQGGCSYVQKILLAQHAGAVAVIIQNDVNDFIYPGMSGWQAHHENVTIPAVMIGKTDGETLRNEPTVQVLLDASVRFHSDFFAPAEGVTVIDMSDPLDPKLKFRHTTEFMFSHNVYIEENRPIMYVCGTSNGKFREGQETWNYVANGGMVMYDVTSPDELKLLGMWNGTYIHDMMERECDGVHYLFGASITDDDVYVWDVTVPADPQVVMKFHGRQGSAHNIWVDDTCRVMYVTHESVNEPITVWQFFETADKKIDFNVQPKYLGSLASNQFAGTLPHNVLVKDDILWAAYYSEGVLAWDISVPSKPTLLAHYETSEFPGGFHGVWGVYPFASNGLIYASDREEGLFVLKLEDKEDEPKEQSYKTTAIGLGVFAAVVLIVLIVVIVMYFQKGKGGYDSV